MSSAVSRVGTGLAAVATITAVGALAAGCGGQEHGGSTHDAASWHGCSVTEVTRHGRPVARADLDHDGRDESVRLVTAGRCAGSLVVVRDRVPTGIDVSALGLRAEGARVVRPHGGGELVLVRSRERGAGLEQAHLFAAPGQRLRELRRPDGAPLLPAVRVGGRTAPQAASCAPRGGITVVVATAHEPVGIVLAWDVTTTTYDVRHGRVRSRSTEVLRAVAEPVLHRQAPELYAGRLLGDCGG